MAIETIDVCTWQTRSPTEILIKAFSVHISTMILLIQFGSRLKMPFKAKCWFVVRSMLFPTWTVTALLLNVFGKVAAHLQRESEGEKDLKEVLCEAIGMYVVGAQDTLPLQNAENQEDDGRFRWNHEYGLPERIPLAEVDRFTFTDTSSPENTLRYRQVSKKTKWSSKSFSIFLLAIYLLQAAMTFVLALRRSQFTKYKFTADEEPIEMWQSEAHWWDSSYASSFQDGFSRGPAISPADSASAKVAILGLVVASIYVILQILDLKWEFTDTQQPWKYTPEPQGNREHRFSIGMCASYIVDHLLHRYLGTLSSYRRAWHMLSELVRLALYPSSSSNILEYRIFFVAGTLLLMITWQARPIEVRMPHWLRGNAKRYLGLSFLFQDLLRSFDFGRQDPTLYHFMDDAYRIKLSEDKEKRDKALIVAFVCQLRYYLYITGFAIPLIVFGVLDTLETYYGSRTTLGRMTTKLGCVYRGDLDGWKWKDPIADLLWAF